MSDISPELVERMVVLVRDLHADHLRYNLHDRQQDFCQRTAAIVAELPEPVDPDMIEARELVCVRQHVGQANIIREGKMDHMLDVRAAFDGIKRGRELAGQP